MSQPDNQDAANSSDVPWNPFPPDLTGDEQKLAFSTHKQAKQELFFTLRFTGPHAIPNKCFMLKAGGEKEIVNIGRSDRSDILVALPGVSSLHAQLRLVFGPGHDAAPSLCLEDYSTNSTGVRHPDGTVRALVRGGQEMLQEGSCVILPLKVKSDGVDPAKAACKRACFSIDFSEPPALPSSAEADVQPTDGTASTTLQSNPPAAMAMQSNPHEATASREPHSLDPYAIPPASPESPSEEPPMPAETLFTNGHAPHGPFVATPQQAQVPHSKQQMNVEVPRPNWHMDVEAAVQNAAEERLNRKSSLRNNAAEDSTQPYVWQMFDPYFEEDVDIAGLDNEQEQDAIALRIEKQRASRLLRDALEIGGVQEPEYESPSPDTPSSEC